MKNLRFWSAMDEIEAHQRNQKDDPAGKLVKKA
jgi:hypothetical protein